MKSTWLEIRLDEISEIIMGQSPPSSSYNSNKLGLPFFQGKAEFTKLSPIPIKWCKKPKKVASKNDILLSVRAPVGAVNIADQKCCIGRGLTAIRYNKCVKYLFYFFQFNEDKLNSIGTGSTFKAISKSQISNLQIPFPPLNEQHRIVEKIEELFTKLDAAVTELKNVKKQLKRYRQSVLKSAFEGKLTEEWRKEKNIKEIWIPTKFNNFCKLQRGHDLPLKNIVSGDYAVITSSGIKGYHNEYKAKGPCLITGRSGSVGNVFYYDMEYFWPHNTTLFAKDFCSNFPKFIYYYFLQFNFKTFSASTAVPTLDRKQLYNEIVNVPTFDEQNQIVLEIETRLSVADKIEEEIDRNLKKTEQLRQSILKKAFEGKLVPQAPNDPPASELLEQIKKEKQKNAEK